MNIAILPTLDTLAAAAAENFIEHARESIARSGRFTVALTGGTTPRDTYALLATTAYATRVDWTRVLLFWGDERCVPPDDDASNFRMAREALIDHVPIPPQNVHRMRGEDRPEAAAAAYEALIDEIVGPAFDLVHLGMGTDAHIASLFPGSAALHETQRRVVAAYAENSEMWRITLTPVAINNATAITFIVGGAEKADAIARVLHGPHAPDETPAQIVAPENKNVSWLVDAAAAAKLP